MFVNILDVLFINVGVDTKLVVALVKSINCGKDAIPALYVGSDTKFDTAFCKSIFVDNLATLFDILLFITDKSLPGLDNEL